MQLNHYEKYTDPVSQRGLSYGDAVSMVILTRRSREPVTMQAAFVKNSSYDGVTSDEKLHKSLVIEVSCEASRQARRETGMTSKIKVRQHTASSLE